MTTTLDITGMTCSACAMRIEKKLNRTSGVTATVNYATERARVELSTDSPPIESIIETVEAMGYGAAEHAAAQPSGLAAAAERPTSGAVERDAWQTRATWCVALGVPVVALSMITSWQFRNWQWLCFALSAPVATWGAAPFHRAAWKNLRQGAATMDTLVSIGVVAAFGWSTWALFFTPTGDSGATMSMALFGHDAHGALAASPHLYLEVSSTIIAFLSLGRWFEHRVRREGRGAIAALAELAATDAVVIRGGRELRIAARDLEVGERYVVRPGDRLAADGVVVDGAASINSALITGESQPMEVGVGSNVLAGTINTSGRLVIEAVAVGADGALARLADLLEDAESQKSATQRLADQIAAVFVPIVVALAVATLGFWLARDESWATALRPAVATLIVACPCALGLATPMALLIGSGRGAQLGLIIRGPAALESARRADVIVLDKTGTVTTGTMAVTATITHDDRLSAEQVLTLAAAVETGSEHPIGKAIVAAASPAGQPIAVGFRSTAGIGVEAEVDGHVVGVRRASVTPGFSALDDLMAGGATVVIVERDDVAIGAIAVADTVKPTSPAAIAAFRAAGLRPILLTGDNELVARKVAAEVGIDDVRAGVLPAGKVAAIRALQADGHRVAMVGDGVNDAAALAAADLGIALGTGTDVAQEAADLTVVNGELSGAVDAIALARRTMRTIHGNLMWAFGYNLVMVPLAMADLLSPALAGAAMALSSVLVVTNSLRLRRFRTGRTS